MNISSQSYIKNIFVFILMLFISAVSYADIDIDDKPIMVTDPLPPNIMFILDDSGSMSWYYMPDSLNCSSSIFYRNNVFAGFNNQHSYNVGYENNSTGGGLKCMSSDFNNIYYNPETKYDVPLDSNGSELNHNNQTSFRSALTNGYYDPWSSRVNLSNWIPKNGYRTGRHNGDNNYNYYCDSYPNGGRCDIRDIRFCNNSNSNTSGDNCNSEQYWLNSNNATDYYKFTYLKFNSNNKFNGNNSCAENNGKNHDSCYEIHEVDPDTNPDQAQNVAIWYTYYRSRLNVSKSGIYKAFEDLNGGYRLGYGRINKSNSVIQEGVKSYSEQKNNFYNWIYNVGTSGSTPLRSALDDVGEYFKGDAPYIHDNHKYSCQQNYTILMTDGYWNGNTPSNISNSDNTAGDVIKNPSGEEYQYVPSDPFKDNMSDTLADVAMKYWKMDLKPDLDNDVATSATDPAFWQHMVTMTIGFGVTGTVDPTDAFNKINTGEKVNWTNSRIDDLIHAAVNSRGGYYSAQNPQEFTAGLEAALDKVKARISSSSNLASNTTSLVEDSVVYQARYQSGSWDGTLSAIPLDSNGNTEDAANWNSTIPDSSAREVITFVKPDANSSAETVAFSYSTLSSDLLGYLDNDSDLVNYLRGDRSKEQSNNGPFRNRPEGVLGDIVHSSPYYVGPPTSDKYVLTGWSELGSFETFVSTDAVKNRLPVVYVGANDGMLHAFNANNGQEIFAYMPAMVIKDNIKAIADPDYDHQYFMDGNLAATDVYFPGVSKGNNKVDGGWHTVLVGSLGRGGKGLFALDVTDPQKPSVLWELSGEDTGGALGYSTGTPVIARFNDGRWYAVAGNGYNSDLGGSKLIVVDIETGDHHVMTTTASTVNNGLSGPFAWDSSTTADAYFDEVYAGDLSGNVWKFDVSNISDKSQTTIAGKSEKVFTAKQSQAITTDMVGVYGDDRKLWLFFGTGKYLAKSDTSDEANALVQTWYGFKPVEGAVDMIDANSDDFALMKREVLLTSDSSDSIYTERAISQANAGDMYNKQGWYMDLPANGERMIYRNRITNGYLIGSTIIPEIDPCSPGGTGFIMAVNPFTGARIDSGFFRYNNSSSYATMSVGEQQNVAVSGISAGSIPSSPILIGNELKTGLENTGIIEVTIPDAVAGDDATDRLSWRELVDD